MTNATNFPPVQNDKIRVVSAENYCLNFNAIQMNFKLWDLKTFHFTKCRNNWFKQLTELLTERYLSTAEKLQLHCPNRLPTSAELEEADEVPGFRKIAIPPGKYYIRSLSQQNLPMTNRTYGAGYFDRRAVVNAHDERFVPTTLGKCLFATKASVMTRTPK